MLGYVKLQSSSDIGLGLTNGTPNHTNGKRKCSDSSNQVIGTDNSGDNRSRDDNASYSEPGDHEDPPKFVQIEAVSASQGTTT
jgi:hypothetical protein